MSRSICVASFVALWLVTLLCALALLTLVILCAVSCWAILTRRQLSYIFASSKIVRVEQKPTVILRSSEMFLTVSLLNEQKAIKTSVVKFYRSILFYPECKIFWGFWGKGQEKGYPFPFPSPSESLQLILTFRVVVSPALVKGNCKILANVFTSGWQIWRPTSGVFVPTSWELRLWKNQVFCLRMLLNNIEVPSFATFLETRGILCLSVCTWEHLVLASSRERTIWQKSTKYTENLSSFPDLSMAQTWTC